MVVLPDRDEVLGQLAPITDAIRWAIAAAERSTADQYEPATGHDNRWLGNTRRNQIIDRIDRGLGTGNYAPPREPDAPNDDSRIFQTLNEFEIDSRPLVDPGSVRREDICQSVSWRYGDYRLFLQSFRSESFDDWNWSKQRSKVKLAIARNTYAAEHRPGVQLSLDIEIPTASAESLSSSEMFPEIPILLAYRVSASGIEAGLGLSRDNTYGGSPWHWLSELAPWDTDTMIKPQSVSETPPSRINKQVSLKQSDQWPKRKSDNK